MLSFMIHYELSLLSCGDNTQVFKLKSCEMVNNDVRIFILFFLILALLFDGWFNWQNSNFFLFVKVLDSLSVAFTVSSCARCPWKGFPLNVSKSVGILLEIILFS